MHYNYINSDGENPVIKQLRRRQWILLGHTLKRSDEVLPGRHYSGHSKAAEEEIPVKEIWEKS